MGNRISIAFVRKDSFIGNCDGSNLIESVALYSHSNGMDLVEDANQYVKELIGRIKANKVLEHNPIGRLEPGTVMVDFIRWLTAKGEFKTWHGVDIVDSNYCLEIDGTVSDNHDNGHFLIDLDAIAMKRGYNPDK